MVLNSHTRSQLACWHSLLLEVCAEHVLTSTMCLLTVVSSSPSFSVFSPAQAQHETFGILSLQHCFALKGYKNQAWLGKKNLNLGFWTLSPPPKIKGESISIIRRGKDKVVTLKETLYTNVFGPKCRTCVEIVLLFSYINFFFKFVMLRIS